METKHTIQAKFWRNATTDDCGLQICISKIAISSGCERQMDKHSLIDILQAVLLTLPPQTAWDMLGLSIFKLKMSRLSLPAGWGVRAAASLEAFFGSSAGCFPLNQAKKAFWRVNTLKTARSTDVMVIGALSQLCRIRFQANLSARENQSEGKTKSKPWRKQN